MLKMAVFSLGKGQLKVDLKAYRQKAYEQFPELMGKLIILSKPIRPAVYGGQLFDLVKEECPEILKTNTLIDDDETAMGGISQRIDEGITQVYSLPLSDIKTMHRASPVKLINPVDFHERNKLQQILSELSKAVPGSLNEVSEDLRAQYEEWNFFNLLGQALWNIKENPRERSDNIQVSWLNNETAFGALFAAANMKKIHGARANEVLNLIKDSYALGLLNGAHICMNAAHAIDYIQSTDALAESWSDIYESSKKVFEDRFELKDEKHLQHFFSIRGNGFRVLSVKQIINALDDMEKDQDLSAYLKIYDHAAARRVKDYNDESSRLKWLLESVALELDWKAEQDLKTCSSLLMELIELEYGIDEYTRELEEKREQFKLALENLDSDYLRSELKDIEKALADPFEDIKE